MNKRYLVLTISAAIGWGFSGTCGEHLFKVYSINGAWLTTMRLLSAGALLILFTLAREGSKNIIGILKSRDLPKLLLFAVMGMMTVQYTYLMAIKYTNSGTATVIQYSGPAFILLYVCLKMHRSPTWRENISLIGILIGVYLIATHGHWDTLVISRLGLLWGVASAIFLAVHDVMPIAIIRNWGALTVTGLSMFIGGICLALLTRPFHYAPALTLDATVTFAAMVVIGTVYSFTAFLIGVSHIGPVNASITACIEPIGASIFSFLWVGTRFTPVDIAGMIIILVSVFIINTSPAKGK